MANRIKTLRLQNLDGNFTSPIDISPDASKVFLNNNKDLQTVLGNLSFASGENVASRLQYLERIATSGIIPEITSSSTISGWNRNKIYVYTGTNNTSTTPNLTNGNWYYYDNNNTQWVSGGSYSAIQTDSSITVSGKAADAAAVRTLINRLDTKDTSLETAIQNLTNSTLGLNSGDNSLKQQLDQLRLETISETDDDGTISLKEEINAIKEEVGVGSGSGNNLQTRITTIEGLIDTIETAIGMDGQSSGSINNQISALSGRIDTLTSNTTGNANNSLQNQITNLTGKTLGNNPDPNADSLQLQIDNLNTLTVSTTNNTSLINRISENLDQIEDLIEAIGLGELSDGTSLMDQIDNLISKTLGDDPDPNADSLQLQIDDIVDEIGLGDNASGTSLKDQIDNLITYTIGDNYDTTQGSLQDQIDNNKLTANQLGLSQDNQKFIHVTLDNVESNKGILISPVTDDSLSISGMAADAGAISEALNDIQDNLNELNAIDKDSFGLVQDPESNMVYITYKDERSDNGIILIGGGGSGGTETNDAIFTASKTTDWNSKTIPETDLHCYVNFNWSSEENGLPTPGGGSVRITVGGVVKTILQVEQGDIEIDLKPYLILGTNITKIRISDSYDNAKTYTFAISVVGLSISSTYNFDIPFDKAFRFNFKPTGIGNKIVHFEIDDIEIGTMETTASDQIISYTIPAQTYGRHSLRCWFTTVINGLTIPSNLLYYEFMFIDSDHHNSIIISSFDPEKNTFKQYLNIVIPFKVYNLLSETSLVEIFIDGVKKGNTLQVNSDWHNFIYEAESAGTKTIEISSGDAESKIISLIITPVNIDFSPVNPTENNLVLYLTSRDRTNNVTSTIRSSWIYSPDPNDPTQDISALFTDFNWKLDGWQLDENNATVLRVMGKSGVKIPYKIFSANNSFSNSGLTIEIDFATKEVANYDFPILKCLDKNSNIGFYLTSQKFSFSGSNTKNVEVSYKDNEHIRISLVIEKLHRLIFIYINGILSKAVQYASGEIFQQSTNPSDIIIGLSEEERAQGLEIESVIDIYDIRIYHNALTSRDIIKNWIADTRDNNLRTKRFNRNQIYNDNNEVTVESIENIPSDIQLPYMIITGNLPTSKLDTDAPGYIPMLVKGKFVDNANPSQNFEFEDCEINVQGTSSSVYFRKNYDLKFKNCKFKIKQQDGTYQIQDTYSLRKGSIPFNRFVLKADVASSESTNNTGLVMFYNDTCPYKTDEMIANSKVRWGIEGIPIVLFHLIPGVDNAPSTIEFLGKYNFNLPKRAPEPYGYPKSAGDESWEVLWNNTANVKFQDNNFADRPGELNYNWKLDFEARFPDSDFYNVSQLKEFVTWVKSTWREDPNIGQDFSAPYPSLTVPTKDFLDLYPEDSNSYTIVTNTDENDIFINYTITFRKDTPSYRLTKFRAEFGLYAEIESAAFYYLFTETFLLIDSWAKNMFIGFHGSLINDLNRSMKRKVVFEPYDMDTAIGIDNTGALKYGYSLESIDKVAENAGGAFKNVFEAQDSVLWSNFRDTFQPYISSMYESLRSHKTWSYEVIENWFEKHQSKWSEAIFNEDSYVKYLYPVYYGLTDESTGSATSSTEYLSKLLGSKEQQRKWWLLNRFYYLDSKYHAGDALTTNLDFRANNKGSITLKYAIDLYASMSFGLSGGLDIERAKPAKTPITFSYNKGTLVQNLETSIWSGNLVTDIENLYKFYPGAVKFAKGTRLKTLKLGSDKITINGIEEDYENSNLTELEVKSPLLEHIDCRNCSNLNILVDLESSYRLKTALFEGTKITGILLPEGCLIQTLHLPNTVTSLYLIDCTNLEDFQIPTYLNILTLFLSNMNPEVIDFVYILNHMQDGKYINIKGFNFTFEDDGNSTATEKLQNLYTLLKRFRGVTRQRNSVTNDWIVTPIQDGKPNTAISGIINIGSISGNLKKQFNDDFPYIEIKANEINSTVYYYDWQGELITTRQVIANKNNPEPNAPDLSPHPERPNTAQYTYTWAGWALEFGGQYTNRALQNIQSDRNVYATYSFLGKTYTVRFLNRTNSSGNYTVLQTKTEVMYGANVSYTGSTPVSYQGPADEYEWGTRGVDPNDPEGNGVYPWNPMPTNIQGNLDCYAQFKDIRSIVSQYFAGTLTNIKLDNLNSVGNYAFYQYPNFTLNTGEIIVQNNIGYAAFQGSNYIYGQNNKPILIKANTIGGYSFDGKYFSSNTRTLKIQAQKLDTASFRGAFTNSLSSNRITTVELIQPENSTNPIQIQDAALRQETLQPFTKLIINSPYKAVLANQTSLPGVFKYCLGGIYVPSDLLNAYKADSNWSRYKYHIFPMEDKDIPIENIDFSTISKTWAEIAADCNSDQPLDTSIYHTGDIKKFTVNGVSHYAILIGINKDKLATDNTKTAKTTWISWSPIGSHRFHSNNTMAVNWEDCLLRTYLKNTIKPQLEEDIRNNLKTVTKTFYDATQALTLITLDDITIPSYYEIIGSSYESSSSLSINYGNLSNQSILRNDNYKQAFLNNLSRESNTSGNDYRKNYWTRTSINVGQSSTIYSGYVSYYYNRFAGMDTRDTLSNLSSEAYSNTSSYYYRIMFCL